MTISLIDLESRVESLEDWVLMKNDSIANLAEKIPSINNRDANMEDNSEFEAMKTRIASLKADSRTSISQEHSERCFRFRRASRNSSETERF